MTETEQLRKEMNELRERIAKLEARPAPAPLDLMRFGGRQALPAGDNIKDAWKFCLQNVWLGATPIPTGTIE